MVSPVDPAAILAIESEEYEYFRSADAHSMRHSRTETVPLLYRLSKEVDPQSTPAWIQQVIGLSLGMGSVEAAERFIGRSTLLGVKRFETLGDFLVYVCFLLATRMYKRALSLLASPPDERWLRTRSRLLLFAIALDRNRVYAPAERLFGRLLCCGISPEESVLVSSYQIASALHQNRVHHAREIFREARQRFGGASNLGYLLRNAGSALDDMDAVEVLNEAHSLFSESGDLFGAATSLNNLGVSLLKLQRLEEARESLDRAYETLRVFGIHHLHVITNNLGIERILVGDFQTAKVFLDRSKRLSRTEMPRLFAGINEAVLASLSGELGQGMAWVSSLEPVIEKHPVDRVRQRFYPNAALIFAAGGGDLGTIQHLCNSIRAHPDRTSQNLTQRVADALDGPPRASQAIARRLLEEYWLPCYLRYWYQNPLEALPDQALTSEAILEDLPDELVLGNPEFPRRDRHV